MPEPISQRDMILGSIRQSLGNAASPAAIAAEYAQIPRAYQQSSTLSPAQLLHLLEDRLLEYDAGVHRCTEDEIPAAIAAILTGRGKSGMAVPASIPPHWLPTGFAFEESGSYDVYQLDQTPGMLSACTAAIAETGSLVLQNVPGQGPRRLSLVPDYHLCVVFAAQVVHTVPEAFARLRATPHLPTTFISGPSATADIEMTRIKGVHGPRFLDVLLVV
jgi:L-lactate dehydrogenase complex protein LldG